MMRSSAVIFPDTVPDRRVIIPLVLVFDELVYLQPVENDNSPAEQVPFCSRADEMSLCRFHAPAPLGKDRERFLHLIKDLHDRGDEYAAQLTHVSLASLTTGRQAGGESRSSILSALLTGHGIDNSAKKLREKTLWQARLILKLGEKFDADQQELFEDFAELNRKEKELFSGLSREAESPFGMTERLQSPIADAARMQRLRLKAWARLFALGTVPLAGSGVFVTTDPEGVDRLAEEYQRSFDQPPAELIDIPLPADHADSERFFAQRQAFIDQEKLLIDQFAGLINDQAAPTEEQRLIFSGQTGKWADALDDHFPGQEYGRCRLRLYRFPDISIRQLFIDSFGRDESMSMAGLSGDARQDTIIGLITDG